MFAALPWLVGAQLADPPLCVRDPTLLSPPCDLHRGAAGGKKDALNELEASVRITSTATVAMLRVLSLQDLA